jgi:hypothetical protein
MSKIQTTWLNFVRARAEAKFAETICTGAVVPKTDAEDTRRFRRGAARRDLLS